MTDSYHCIFRQPSIHERTFVDEETQGKNYGETNNSNDYTYDVLSSHFIPGRSQGFKGSDDWLRLRQFMTAGFTNRAPAWFDVPHFAQVLVLIFS
jgi:hypothetical protein